jgi:hypothetical protein
MLRLSELLWPVCSGTFSKRVDDHALKTIAHATNRKGLCISPSDQILANRMRCGLPGRVPATTPDQLGGVYPLPDRVIT